MGRALLLIVAAAALTLFGTQTRDADRRLRSVRDGAAPVVAAQARQVATSGHEFVRFAALSDVEADGTYDGPATVDGTYAGGTFVAEVTTAASTVTIVTRASHSGADHTVWATYEGGGGASVTVPPPYMRGGLGTGGNLPIMQPLTLRATDPASPASVLVGGNLEFRVGSSPTVIEGFGEASGNVEFRDGQVEADVFQPLANPDGYPLSQASLPKLAFPDFDAGEHVALATRTLPSGLYSGTIALGTAEAPAIVYVDGNFETSGPITFTGYGVVMADGNFIINHDMRSDGANPVGLYSTSNFELRSGSLTVDGNIVSGGNTKFMADTVINGSVTSKSNLEFSGRATINYIPAAAAITEPFWPGQSSTTTTGGGGSYRLTQYSEG